MINSAKEAISLGRLLGRKDYDGAIALLESSLSNSQEDLLALETIGWCHRWSGRDDRAIGFARKALAYDARHFEAIRLLSEIYAQREEHETAVYFTRLGLENYPSPRPAPKGFLWLLSQAAKIFPRLKPMADSAQEDLAYPGKDSAQWYVWAKDYLAWYDATFGATQTPTVH